MYKFIFPDKNIGDSAVTSFYMNIIKKACEKAGKNCEICFSKQNGNKKRDVIVVDEAMVAFHYIKKGYRNIIFWSQGVIPEESFMRNKSYLRFWVLSLIEYITLLKSKQIFLCSEAMLKHYEKKYHIKIRSKSFIMPCFNESKINSESFFLEKKYKKNNFLYVGSIKAWQCFEETVNLYKIIENLSDEPVKLFVYTNQQEEAKEIINKSKIKNFEVSYETPENLAKKIKYFKYGFVLREDTIVNNVATPTKFSNYISNGIIPIYSSCITDFNNQNNKINLGITCDLSNTKDGVQRILNHMKTEIEPQKILKICQDWFDSYYSEERYIQQISKRIKMLDL